MRGAVALVLMFCLTSLRVAGPILTPFLRTGTVEGPFLELKEVVEAVVDPAMAMLSSTELGQVWPLTQFFSVSFL